jgi:hypothetical protein
MIEGLKNIGGFVIGIGALLLLLLISALMINGAVWVGEHVLQWLINLTWIAFAINLVILLPLALFRKTGMFGGIAMYFSSFLFGLTLWFLGLLLTYFTWGFFGVFVGLMLGGIGVVPVAMLAMLLNGEFFVLFILVLLTVLTFGSRFLGIYLAGRAEEKTDQLARQKLAAYEQQ